MPAVPASPPSETAVGRALVPRRFHGVVLEARPRPVRRARTAPPRPARTTQPPPAPSAPKVRPLIGEGPRVDLVTVEDLQAPSPADQLHADAVIRELEAQARRALRRGAEHKPGLDSDERFPSAPAWLALRGSALALHPLYGPSAAWLARFEFADLLAARLHGRSALDILRAQIGPHRADVVAGRVRAFCDAPMSGEARLLMAGAADARALRQTALLAAYSVAKHRGRWSSGARIVAVGGGTAEAAAGLAAELHAPALTLLDRDPLALAAALVLQGDGVRATPVAHDLATGLAAATGRGFDVVDLGGTLGTLSDQAAVALLRVARRALRPGGVVVASNMLSHRPQATFFEHVVRWPGIVRRSPAQLAALIAAAGFPAQALSLAIAAGAPVHVVATIDSAA